MCSPLRCGSSLGGNWDDGKANIRLAGTLGHLNAMPLFVLAQLGQFAPVRLAFAWVKSNEVPFRSQLGLLQTFQSLSLRA